MWIRTLDLFYFLKEKACAVVVALFVVGWRGRRNLAFLTRVLHLPFLHKQIKTRLYSGRKWSEKGRREHNYLFFFFINEHSKLKTLTIIIIIIIIKSFHFELIPSNNNNKKKTNSEGCISTSQILNLFFKSHRFESHKS